MVDAILIWINSERNAHVKKCECQVHTVNIVAQSVMVSRQELE